MMTEETPAKVIGLLGASLFSLMLLFAVSATDQGFNGAARALPSPFDPSNVVAVLNSNPFSPEHVVAFLDNVSSSYSNAVHVAITGPAGESFAFYGQSYKDDVAWLRNDTDVDQQIVAMAGLSDLLWQEPTPMAHPAPHTAQVAGAFTMRFGD